MPLEMAQLDSAALKKESPITKRVFARTKEEICKVEKIKTSLNQICPGVEVGTFPQCQKAMMDVIQKGPGLSITGMIMMSAVSAMYVSKQQKSDEKVFALLETQFDLVDRVDQQKRASDYVPKDEINSPSASQEMANWALTETASSTKFVRKMLESTSGLVDTLHSKVDETDRSPASLKKKLKVVEYRQRVTQLSKKYKYYPSKK